MQYIRNQFLGLNLGAEGKLIAPGRLQNVYVLFSLRAWVEMFRG